MQILWFSFYGMELSSTTSNSLARAYMYFSESYSK